MIERVVETFHGWPSAAVFAMGATVCMFAALTVATAILWWMERRP